MSGLLGKKIGMTSIFDDNGANIPVTVIEVLPNVVTQVKTEDNDGYSSVQVSVEEKKEKATTKALKGHFSKANTTPKRFVREFRSEFPDGIKLGDTLRVEDIFQENTIVSVVGTTKGKGFQGVVKRHGFSGVGDQTHGQHNRLRAPGSVGMGSDPSRVFKGKRMAGRTGNSRVKMKGLQVVRVLADSNLLLVKGSVPGPKKRLLEIHNV